MRVFQKAVFERLFGPARSRAHYAGKQPNASVEYGNRRRLAAAQHDIGEGDLFDLRARVEEPFIKPFKSPAN